MRRRPSLAGSDSKSCTRTTGGRKKGYGRKCCCALSTRSLAAVRKRCQAIAAGVHSLDLADGRTDGRTGGLLFSRLSAAARRNQFFNTRAVNTINLTIAKGASGRTGRPGRSEGRGRTWRLPDDYSLDFHSQPAGPISRVVMRVTFSRYLNKSHELRYEIRILLPAIFISTYQCQIRIKWATRKRNLALTGCPRARLRPKPNME